MDPSEAAGQTDYRQLAKRMGRDTLEKRILKQAGLWAKSVHQGRGIFRLEGFLPLDDLIAAGLKFSGLAGLGRRNYLDVQIVDHTFVLPNLPPEFEGFRLLQLSDLHCDLEPDLIDVVIGKLSALEYDAVVLTGDYHNKIGEGHDASLDLMGRLASHLKQPAYAILGNHDFLEQVAYLEEVGLRVLLNEAEAIERGGRRLWICGVDDPHFFQTDDMLRARASVGAGEAAILLSHSPETYQKAAALGYSIMLSGHTHGGQLCLPGGIAVIKNAPIPRRLLAGPWKEGSLLGYTSRGTGGCGVGARFFCPAEITLHTLRSCLSPARGHAPQY